MQKYNVKVPQIMISMEALEKKRKKEMAELEKLRLKRLDVISEEKVQQKEIMNPETEDDKMDDLEKKIEEMENQIKQEDEENDEVQYTIQNRAALMKLVPKKTKDMPQPIN